MKNASCRVMDVSDGAQNIETDNDTKNYEIPLKDQYPDNSLQAIL